MKTAITISPDLVREFAGQDVLCLHPICQPMADEMQAVIRHQRAQLELAVAAMSYILRVQGDKLLGTEQFTRLTAAIATINSQDVKAVRERFIPGSASLHRSTK